MGKERDMKYIIDTDDFKFTLKTIVVMGIAGCVSKSVDDLEELTADYINENFGELQDTAYQKGLEDGKKAFDLFGAERDSEYRRGLSEGNDIGYKDGVKDGQNEAWECARELYLNGACKDWFGEYFNTFIKNHTAQEAIEKLKAYKQDDKIEVGDIIANNTEPKLKVWVTCFDEIGFCGIAITDFGTVDGGELYSSCSPKGWHKIGHFDIASILEDMRND
jgi:hypothetical protein